MFKIKNQQFPIILFKNKFKNNNKFRLFAFQKKAAMSNVSLKTLIIIFISLLGVGFLIFVIRKSVLTILVP